MYKVAIIGAGQLGSRHLQGAKLAEHPLDLWVVDTCEDALHVACERFGQVAEKTKKDVHFIKEIDLLPRRLDVVIVSSSSKPRLSICERLLAHAEVRYLILEKFLFPALREYDRADSLFVKKKQKVWVNCTRRIFDFYEKIDGLIDKSHPVYMSYKGSNWGLCCNSIHFIDIFMKLNGCLTCQIDFSGLVPKIVESKRSGYIEFYGSEVVTVENGGRLALECQCGVGEESYIIIENNGNRFVVDENGKMMWINGRLEEITVPFQSHVTGSVIDCLIDNGDVGLTAF